MIRNFKALGLALCAVFAFSAAVTSAASAVDRFTAPANGTFVTGIQTGSAAENVFGTKGSSIQVNCTAVTYTGTSAAVAESVEFTPAFTGCTAFGSAMPVDVEGCKVVETGTTDNTVNTNGESNGSEATIRLNCSHTGSIKVTGLGGCTITFSDTSGGNTVNQNLLGVRYTNSSSGGIWTGEMDVTVDNIHYTTTPQCGSFGLPATGNDGFLTQKVTGKGYSDAAHTKQVSITTT